MVHTIAIASPRCRGSEIADGASFERLINELSREFARLPIDGIDDGIERAVRKLGEFGGVDVCYAALLDQGEYGRDRGYAWASRAGQAYLEAARSVSLERYGWYREQLEARCTLHVPSIDEFPPEAAREREDCRRGGILSVLAVPLIVGDRVIGHLSFNSVVAPKRWTEDSLSALNVAAEMIAAALERKRTEGELRFRAELQRLVTQLATGFINLPVAEIDSGIRHALGALGRFAGVERVVVFQLGDDGRTTSLSQEWCAEGVQSYRDRLQDLPRESFAWLDPRLTGGDVVVLASRDELPATAAGERSLFELLSVQSAIAVPLMSADRGAIGVMGFVAFDPNRSWPEGTVELLRVVAEMLVNALERAQADQLIRDSEQRFRELAENMREVFYVWSSESGRVDYVSPAYEQLTGRKVGPVEADGVAWCDCVHADDHDRVRETWREGARSGAYDETYRIVRPDGEVRWVSDRATPVHDAGGGVCRIIGIAEDVTSKKESDERARRHQDELAHALRRVTMGELATSLAHELNQPLSAITNFAQGCVRRLQAGDVDRELLLEAAREMTKQALRAGEVIRSIRSHVRASDSRRVQRRVTELTSSALDLVRVEARHREIDLRIEHRDEHLTVQVDPIQIEQVVLNIVRNAFDAVSDCGAGAIVRVATRRGPDATVEFAVTDSGPGLSVAEAERVFEPFHTTKKSAVGLGLSISRSIVEAHGGKAWVSPAAGGTTFSFCLPLSTTEGAS